MLWNLPIAPSVAAEPIAPDGSFLASVGEDNTFVFCPSLRK
jgi:hypothetical protein